MNLDRLIDRLVDRHRNQPFTSNTLKAWLTESGIGIGEIVAIIQVIVWLWPKKRITGPPTCRKRIGSKVCGAAIVHSELKADREGRMLELICERKHITKKLIEAAR